MPQWRKLYLKTIDSIDVNAMPDFFTRYLWFMLILIADKEGRGVYKPVWIRSKALPLGEDVTLKKVQSAMDWFEQRGMIAVYTVDGHPYFEICSFHRYQSTSREAASVIPANPDGAGATPDQLQSNSVTDVDVDADADKDADVDADASRDDDRLSTEYAPYEQVFIEETRYPLFYGGPERWLEGFQRMAEAGASPDDLRQAIRELQAKKYNITSPLSVVNPTLNVMSQRQARPPDSVENPIAEQLKERGIRPV